MTFSRIYEPIMNLTICPTLPTLPMPRVHRCCTKKYRVIIQKTSKQLQAPKTSSKKNPTHGHHHGKKKPNSQHTLTMEMEITVRKRNQTPSNNKHPPISGWCHCRFGYGFGHWTCQFLGFMATRWSKTWTWWYPRCDGRFEAWHHSCYTWWSWVNGVNDLGGWGGVGLWGPVGLMYLEILAELGWDANVLKWKKFPADL